MRKAVLWVGLLAFLGWAKGPINLAIHHLAPAPAPLLESAHG